MNVASIVKAFVFTLLMVPVVSVSATFKKLEGLAGMGVDALFITGDIEEGDANKFEQLSDGMGKAVISLDSNGGLVTEALRIGAKIKLSNWSTMVVPSGSCLSACGLIWISANRRYLDKTANLGFHAAYRMIDGVPVETGMGNAEIGSYLTHMGLRIEAIRYVTQAPPNGMNRVTPDIARALGIEVYEQEGFNVTTPEEIPTADKYAYDVAMISGLDAKCEGIVRLNNGYKESDIKPLFQSGRSLVGNEGFFDLIMLYTQKVKEDYARDGWPQWCVNTVAKLTSYSSFIHVSPSYNCDKAIHDDEVAICSSNELSIYDMALSVAYKEILDGSVIALKKSVVSSQKEWLKIRASCGRNDKCIASAYQMRFAQLTN